MTVEIRRDYSDITVHVLAEHGWTDLDYVLSDLRNSIANDHRAEHDRADQEPGSALLRPHTHLERIDRAWLTASSRIRS